jgi:MFS superfamily sulfate permease-like transporter
LESFDDFMQNLSFDDGFIVGSLLIQLDGHRKSFFTERYVIHADPFDALLLCVIVAVIVIARVIVAVVVGAVVAMVF